MKPALTLAESVERLARLDPEATRALLDHFGIALKPEECDSANPEAYARRLGRGQGTLLSAYGFAERAMGAGRVLAW